MPGFKLPRGLLVPLTSAPDGLRALLYAIASEWPLHRTALTKPDTDKVHVGVGSRAHGELHVPSRCTRLAASLWWMVRATTVQNGVLVLPIGPRGGTRSHTNVARSALHTAPSKRRSPAPIRIGRARYRPGRGPRACARCRFSRRAVHVVEPSVPAGVLGVNTPLAKIAPEPISPGKCALPFLGADSRDPPTLQPRIFEQITHRAQQRRRRAAPRRPPDVGSRNWSLRLRACHATAFNDGDALPALRLEARRVVWCFMCISGERLDPTARAADARCARNRAADRACRRYAVAEWVCVLRSRP